MRRPAKLIGLLLCTVMVATIVAPAFALPHPTARCHDHGSTHPGPATSRCCLSGHQSLLLQKTRIEDAPISHGVTIVVPLAQPDTVASIVCGNQSWRCPRCDLASLIPLRI